jgi:uncharacterized protein YndB with AHSA1/START domain
MSESIRVEATIPATPRQIFTAWLDGALHSAMTGSPATVNPDGTFTSWDNYSSGLTTETVADQRIVQRWRAADFPEGTPDSIVTVTLEAHDDGTHLTVTHDELPDGQAESFRKGWVQFYFEPMTKHFASTAAEARASAPVPAPTAPMPAPKQAAPKQVAPKKPAPKQAAPPKKAAPKKAAPKKAAPKKAAPQKAAPKKTASKKAAPKKAAPKKAAPKKAAPKKTASKKAAPKKAAPKKAAPKKKAAGKKRR